MVIRAFKSWLNNNVDKVAHFGLSNFFCWIAFLPLFLVFNGFWWSVLISVMFSFTLGYYKESKDHIFDKYDILANVLGILFFILNVVILYYT